MFAEDARIKFKKYVNTLAQTKADGDDKYLILKTKYHGSLDPLKQPSQYIAVSQNDPRVSLGIPRSPASSDYTLLKSPAQRQPPPYRPPPPVSSPISPTNSLDNISLGSIMSLQDGTPQAPPRRKASDKQKSFDEEITPVKQMDSKNHVNGEEKQTVSVKERLEKFNRMASMEDELSSSPRQLKSAEKLRNAKVRFYIIHI